MVALADMIVLAAAAALIAVFWLLLALPPCDAFRATTSCGPPRSLPAAPRVAVLVPARDEAAMLPLDAALAAAPGLPGLRGAPDRRRLDRRHGRGRRCDSRRSACASSRRATSRRVGRGRCTRSSAASRRCSATAATLRPPAWLLLTDADIRHPPTSIASLVAKAQRGGYDLVSVMARLSTAGAWERLLIPPFVYFFHLLYPFRAVSLRSSQMAAAAGGCVLVRAQALLDAGGFAAIRGALIDDVALARLLKGSRRRLWLGLDPEIESVRRYSLPRPLAHGGAQRLRPARLPLLVGAAGDARARVLLRRAFDRGADVGRGVAPRRSRRRRSGWRSGSGDRASARDAGRSSRGSAITGSVTRIAWSLTFPLAALLYGAMTVGSAWDHLRGRGSAWKGRGYDPRGRSRVE